MPELFYFDSKKALQKLYLASLPFRDKNSLLEGLITPIETTEFIVI